MPEPFAPSRAHGLALAADLAAWYKVHARRLPWRVPPGGEARPDPYKTMVCEIILQQTTVAVGRTRVPAFLERFPTVESLAHAPWSEVAEAWAGLGYYARARRLQEAARLALERHGGVPTDEAALRDLPGVGPYTAAAVAAFAGGAPTVVVDGNVERVMARVHAISTPLPRARKALWAAAAAATPEQGAGDHAQALMDLAAAICRPRAPSCLLCPIRAHCAAGLAGDPDAYPVRPVKKAKPHRVGICYVAWDGGEGVWVERRPDAGLLPGTLGFPGGAWVEEGEPDALPPAPADWRLAGRVRHAFAHFHLDLEVWAARVEEGVRMSDRLEKASLRADRALPGQASVFAKAWETARSALAKGPGGTHLEKAAVPSA